jgi:formate-dependent nitrite reductase membrane component NrfD
MSPEAAVAEVVHGRHNELIDPSMHIWGWEIPVYLFLGGLAAGLMILPALLELGRRRPAPLPRVVRAMPFVALAALTVGMVALFLDLEFKSHVHRFYLAFEPASPMSWGSWILILVYPAGLLMAAGLLDAPQRRWLVERSPLPCGLARWVLGRFDAGPRTVLWAAVGVGVALGTYTGLLLGTLAARPQWNTTILGPLFLVSGVSTAAALVSLLRPSEEVHKTLTRWELWLIPAEVTLLALMLMDLATGSRAAQLAAGELLGGTWTGPFWALVVFVGLLAPFGLKAAEMHRRLPPVAVAPVLVLVGSLSLRWILVAAGQASSFGLIP